MSSRRLQRVTELLHQEVSKLLLEMQDRPGMGLITVLAVRLTADFAFAKVYYSVLGTDEERQRVKVNLEKARGYLRSRLGNLESLKNPPELQFILDNSPEEAQKVLETLNRLKKDDDSFKSI